MAEPTRPAPTTTTVTTEIAESAVTLDLGMLPIPAFSVDHHHRITACNAAAERLFGSPASAIIGQRCTHVMSTLASAACLGCDQWCGRAITRADETPGNGAHSVELRLGDSSERLQISVLQAQAVSGDARYVHILQVLPAEALRPSSPRAPTRATEGEVPATNATTRPRDTAHNSDARNPVSTSRPRPADWPAISADIPDPPPVHLTGRELDILRLLAEGLTTHEIAERSYISYATARNHISSIIAKLGAATRLQAVIFARELSLL